MPVGCIPGTAARLAGIPVWDLILACDLIGRALHRLKPTEEPKPVKWAAALRKARTSASHISYAAARTTNSDRGWALAQMQLVARDMPDAMPSRTDARASAQPRQATTDAHSA